MGSSRIALFDNAKLVLITLVVIGHFIDRGATANHEAARALFVFIYSFHMPLFVFISGLFLSREKASLDRTLTKVIYFIVLGFVLKIGFSVSGSLLYQTKPSFNLLSDAGLPWFMFAMAAYYTTACLLRNADFWIVEILAIILALVVGYDNAIGDYLYLSRIIVYFPFFWIGFNLNPLETSAFFRKRAVVVAGAIIIIAFGLVCVLKTQDIYTFRGLFTGRNSYKTLDKEWVDRLVAYAITTSMCFSVLAITPNRRLPLVTLFGSRSLQIYAFHYFALYIFLGLGVIDYLQALNHGWLLLIPLAIAVTLLFALSPFQKPLQILERRISVHSKTNH